MAECLNCDDRGFVFLQVDETHRKQILCPKCEGRPIRARAMALLLTGEKIDLPEYDGTAESMRILSQAIRELPYDQQMFVTMRQQLKE